MKTIVFLGDTILNDEPLGIQRYAYEIIKEIDKKKPAINCELLIPEDIECSITLKNIQIVRYGKYKNHFIWRQIAYPMYLNKHKAIGVDLTLGLAIMGNGVICLHDCIFEDFPRDFIGIIGKLKRYSYLFRTHICVKKAKRIITVSETSKQEIIKHYSVSEEKISVVYNAWQHMLRVSADDVILHKYNLERGKFYFSLGSGLPHKNFEWIVYAAKKNSSSIFVISGTNRLSNYSINDSELDNIVFTGYLTDAEIKSLMSNCKAFLHPAVMEGFGIPPLEALSCGVKIAVSNTSCLPEVYGESAVYFNPFDYNVDLDKLLSKKTSSDETLAKYSWEKSADRLYEILLEL